MTYRVFIFVQDGDVVAVQSTDHMDADPCLSADEYEIHTYEVEGEVVNASELFPLASIKDGSPEIHGLNMTKV